MSVWSLVFQRELFKNTCNRLQDSGSVARRLGLGRICATIAREDLYELSVYQEPAVKARMLQNQLLATGNRISDQMTWLVWLVLD